MFLKKYQHKIKTAEELVRIIGSFPRDQKVVMCHGVFDVVHPGHMRHLLFAKSKADILVASLTADIHICKGMYRPHVPQAIRAANLAAFEMVDYVIIDFNKAPLDNLRLLQPDFFAKGYEYSGDDKPLKTLEEEEILKSYGGDILFTPGDVVYSSSHLINIAEPSLRYEKLVSAMEAEDISAEDLYASLKGNEKLTVHVIGDTIVDGILQTNVIGGQIKTPTLSVRYESQTNYVGGAGVVAKHLKAAGANVIFTTVLGDDERAKFVLDDLVAAGVQVNAITDQTRPTTYKNAVVAGGYRLVKIDTLDNSSISDTVLHQLVDGIANTPADAVVFSDFRHGIFNKRTIPALREAIPEVCYKVADSQVASRWGDITEFQNFDLITPNEREARFSLGDQDTGVRPLASNLYKAANCTTLMLKLGEKGLLTCGKFDQTTVVDTFVDQVVDAVGSGDALLAYAMLAMVKGFSPVVASIVGSMAAACECEEDGNIPITPHKITQKLKRVLRRAQYSFDGPEVEVVRAKVAPISDEVSV
ncbi:MAG: ADP-heptose synthase [Coxiella sp. (in: Bacteria)]|nr:MAG: ADP-heptose synthase [Coxiella sp. (in: g-proteobacteria)]